MAVWKRFLGKKVAHGSKDYNRATWIAEGMCEGERYKESLPQVKTRKDAETEEEKIRELIRKDEYKFRKNNSTFGEYIENVYLPYIKTNNPSWENNKKYQVKRLVGFFGKKKLKSINRALCERFKQNRMIETVPCQKCTKFKETCFRCSGDKARYKAPCWACKKRIADFSEHQRNCEPPRIEPATVNRDLITLSDILTLAVRDAEIKENPMTFVPLLPEAASRERILQNEEYPRLFEAVKKNRKLWAIVMIAITTGWRRGRILGIEKEHLDERTQSVWVKKSKREKAKRMPVSDITWTVLTWLAAQTETGHLFRAEATNEPLKSFYSSWWKVLQEAGIKDFRFHDLRHTTATGLFDVGLREFGIQTALGHSKLTTTELYVNVADESLRDALNQHAEKVRNYVM